MTDPRPVIGEILSSERPSSPGADSDESYSSQSSVDRLTAQLRESKDVIQNGVKVNVQESSFTLAIHVVMNFSSRPFASENIAGYGK